jgi:hypothetical protein
MPMEPTVMSLVEKARELLDRIAALDAEPTKAASVVVLELQQVVIDLRLLCPPRPCVLIIETVANRKKTGWFASS